MTRLISTTLLLMSLAATCFAQQHHEVHEDNVDIDEWQVMRVAAAKDPFEKSRQFTINFANYANEEWCYPLPGGKVISHFGGARRHGGTDIKTKAGDTIRAAFPGVLLEQFVVLLLVGHGDVYRLPSYSCNPLSLPLTAGKPGFPTAPAFAHLRSNGNKQARQISSSRHAHRTRKKNHIPTAVRCDDQRTALQSPMHRAATANAPHSPKNMKPK